MTSKRCRVSKDFLCDFATLREKHLPIQPAYLGFRTFCAKLRDVQVPADICLSGDYPLRSL
jgi:hypothetical protein